MTASDLFEFSVTSLILVSRSLVLYRNAFLSFSASDLLRVGRINTEQGALIVSGNPNLANLSITYL
jgi:hypothetical protein